MSVMLWASLYPAHKKYGGSPRQLQCQLLQFFQINRDKATTNGIYMNLGNYPHILQVTTRGNKLEIYLLIQSNYKWIKTV